jgi:hypothetical protein
MIDHTQGQLSCDVSDPKAELWRLYGGSDGSYQVAQVMNLNKYPENRENARRLVACWNACAGASTDDLEQLCVARAAGEQA